MSRSKTPGRVTRHVQFDEEAHAEIVDRFGDSIGLSAVIRSLFEDYLNDPKKFSLASLDPTLERVA